MRKINVLFTVLCCFALGFSAISQDTEFKEDGGSGGGGDDCEGPVANLYCPYWDVEYEVTQGLFESTVKVTCRTGGIFYCEIPD